MKNIQKIPLCLFTMIAISTWNTASAAYVEVDFTDGAEFAALVTGGVNFNGSGNVDFTGSATGNVKMSAGNVKVATATPLGANVIMNGGSLEPTAAMSLPTLEVDAPSILTANVAVALTALSGASKLTVAGTDVVTPADLHASNTPMDISGIVNVGAAGSLLPNAAIAVLSGGLVDIKGVTPGSLPGTTAVKSGAVLQVDPSLTVPVEGSGSDVFSAYNPATKTGGLQFDSGSKLLLGNGANWGRTVVINTAT